LLISASNPYQLLDELTHYQPPADLDRWVHRKEVK
jgi:hypothetical protein